MLWVIEAFLFICLLLYCLLAGADFGAGALECFVPQKYRKRHEELVHKAMGPVWEANHIWLIIALVILFNAFPLVYSQYSIYFHLPLTLMLVGIVFRGCSFTFRNYDAVKDRTHRYYSRVFSASSLLTPIMFGMILGGMFFGVDPQATGYYQKYVAPWWNWPCLAVGIFILTAFAYLAAVYLIGETGDRAVQDYYAGYAQKACMLMLIAGGLVFLLAEKSGHHLLALFFHDPICLWCFAGATLATVLFWWKIRQWGEWRLRLVAGTQVGLVLSAWLALLFPHALFYKDGTQLSLPEAAAPAAVIHILAWSLIIGACLFVPILYYLIRVFKVK